jgi:hypothetical protein
VLIKLGCGHFYSHNPPLLNHAPDTVVGSGFKPPDMCPDCARKKRQEKAAGNTNH